MSDSIAPSPTTSEERFVVILALIAGLGLFGWLIPKTFLRHGEDSTVSPATASAGDVWTHPDFPDASTSRIDDLEGRLADVESLLDGRITELGTSATAQNAELHEKIASLVREIEELKGRLFQLEQQPAADATLRAELVERIRFLELQLGRLRYDTAQSRLFVENGETLGGKASDLYHRLQNLSTADTAAFEAEYARIGQEIPARPLVRVKYGLSESRVPEADLPRLKQLVADSPEGTFFLVVGYADRNGEPEPNRVLSSKRASHAAETLDRALKPGQTVRAIYLGQTDRFGPDDENRVVEIWSIHP